MQSPSIYIIEDNEALAHELAHLLELNKYTALTHSFAEAPTTATAIANKALEAQASCILLDLALPGVDGFSICKELRSMQPTLPIIVLTSSAAEFDEVMALTIGANDFITKPYKPAILLARLAAALKSANTSNEQVVLTYNNLNFYPTKHHVSFTTSEGLSQSRQLSPNEAVILRSLITQPGCIISRKELMCELWDSSAFVDDNTLTVNINRLRHSLTAIGAPSTFIKTHRGFGYSL